MHTARSLPYWRVSLTETPSGHSPLPCGQTDTCENTTLPQTCSMCLVQFHTRYFLKNILTKLQACEKFCKRHTDKVSTLCESFWCFSKYPFCTKDLSCGYIGVVVNFPLYWRIYHTERIGMSSP